MENTEKPVRPEWQERLVKERAELLEKTIKLKNALDDSEFKLSAREWEMLREQFGIMREYAQILTTRCVYYNLIPAGDLHLDYSHCRR